jgi:hypothetical protein
MRSRRLPYGRLLSGILATCASVAFGTQFLLERLEGDGDLDSRAILLLAIALGGLLVVLAVGLTYRRASGARDLKRRISLDLRDLPFAGRGAGFFGLVLSSALSFAFLAHLGEDAFDRGDLLAWLCAALVVALCAALAAWFAVRALPALATAFAVAFVGETPPLLHRADTDRAVARIERRDAWPPTLFNRPPPLLQA